MTEKLPFTRDRWLECYLFSLSITFEPQYGYGREVLNKVNQMITTIDDIYDVYGTVEELELFTDAVDRFVSFHAFPPFFWLFLHFIMIEDPQPNNFSPHVGLGSIKFRHIKPVCIGLAANHKPNSTL